MSRNIDFVTSDLHLFHVNLTRTGSYMLDRGFDTVEEMNNHYIEAHNRVVRNNQTTLNLGDLSLMGKPQEVLEVFNKMKGSFIFVLGNHDSSKVINYLKKNNYKMKSGVDKFTFYDVGFKFAKDGIIFLCTHYPLMVGERGKLFNLHGHIHQYKSPIARGLNVCVDNPAFSYLKGEPIPIETIMQKVRQIRGES